MNDGIRIMDSEMRGSESVFVLGMTGAGKSTVALLLTNISTLYACKRSEYDLRFIIRDVGDEISTIDSQSKTKIPEVRHSPELGTTFYDCPGFADTNSTDELTTAYFIKHALDSSKKVKFLLVAPFQVLQVAGDRHYLANLLLHTVKTVKNVEKYAESFALAVTFAEPLYPTSDTVRAVAGYLRTFLKEELYRNFEGQDDVLNNAKVLLNSLLVQDDKGYIAIAAFRKPTQHGPLSNLTWAQEDRQGLLTLLTEDTLYQTASSEDFGYYVSDTGKLRAAELLTEIDNSINQNMKQFWTEIQQGYAKVLNSTSDPIQQKTLVKTALETCESVLAYFIRDQGQNMTWMSQPKSFVEALTAHAAPLGMSLSTNPNLAFVLMQDSHLSFVQNVTGKPANLQYTRWLTGLQPMLAFLED